MCGINGILRIDPTAAPVDLGEALRTRERMRPRGPDGEGLWTDGSGDIVLAHRRLAIIDLSEAGLQPMASADGRYHIVFNGEVYNYRELRSEVGAEYPFRSHTDTEVILALFARKGVRALGQLRGMFALAIWDAVEKRLLLARDPNGIKPLYYANDRRQLRFASQVKALVAGGAIDTRHDPAGLCGFLLWGAVPEPWTVYESVKSLPAGHLAWASRAGLSEPEPLPADSHRRTAVDLAAALEESVKAHLVADVPVAVFLSAGLDSSLIATLAAGHTQTPPVAITLRFREFEGSDLDEGPLAAETAKALGAKHVERWVSRDEFLGAWGEAVSAMDQPSIDGLNTYWVCKAARESGVRVALSGLGGDELLGGYSSFRDVPRIVRWVNRAIRVPGSMGAWPLVTQPWTSRRPKISALLRYGSSIPGAYFLRRAVYLPEDLPALLGPARAEAGLRSASPVALAERVLTQGCRGDDHWGAISDLESQLYMRHQLLRDSDWASMAHSVELRVPLVDARLQASGRAMPTEARAAGKAALVRVLLAERLPANILARRKTGFVTPFAHWMAGTSASRAGLDSRQLALRILEEWGVRHENSVAGHTRAVHRPPEPAAPPGRSLILAPGLFREAGGIQTYGRNLVEALRQTGAQPLVLSLNDQTADLAALRAQNVDCAGFGRSRAAFAARAIAIARHNAPSHVWIAHRNFLALAPFVRNSASRIFLLVYGIDAWPPLSRTERWALRAVDRVLAISPYTAACIRHAGHDGAVELLPCSLPHDWVFAEPVAPDWSEPYRILSVSRLALPDRYKGIDHTIEALARLTRQGVHATLDVVGEGPDKDRLQSIARREQVEDRVRLLGRVDDDRLRELYRECDLFVLPSGAEGFGIVYLEALAAGRPVIAGEAGGVPYVIRQGETGWLVPPGRPDALARSIADRLGDPQGSLRVADRGRRMVMEEFSHRAFAARVADLVTNRRRAGVDQ